MTARQRVTLLLNALTLALALSAQAQNTTRLSADSRWLRVVRNSDLTEPNIPPREHQSRQFGACRGVESLGVPQTTGRQGCSVRYGDMFRWGNSTVQNAGSSHPPRTSTFWTSKCDRNRWSWRSGNLLLHNQRARYCFLRHVTWQQVSQLTLFRRPLPNRRVSQCQPRAGRRGRHVSERGATSRSDEGGIRLAVAASETVILLLPWGIPTASSSRWASGCRTEHFNRAIAAGGRATHSARRSFSRQLPDSLERGVMAFEVIAR